jgi:hypothetical protein
MPDPTTPPVQHQSKFQSLCGRIEEDCHGDGAAPPKEFREGAQALLSRDGNGASFPANPWGIHLLGDGYGEL